jgi:hypothetical protein
MALALRVTTGELTEIERFMVSSERGGWKSAHRGNSLAAYSTPTVRSSSPNPGGRGALRKAPSSLQDRRWRIYLKAKADDD